MTDLFHTHKELLLTWMRQKGYFSSHDVNLYGTTNYYDSATRRVRELVRSGQVRRLDNNEKTFRGFKTKCAVYEWVREENITA